MMMMMMRRRRRRRKMMVINVVKVGVEMLTPAKKYLALIRSRNQTK